MSEVSVSAIDEKTDSDPTNSTVQTVTYNYIFCNVFVSCHVISILPFPVIFLLDVRTVPDSGAFCRLMRMLVPFVF